MNAVDETIQRPFSFDPENIKKQSRSVGENHALACDGSADYYEKRGRTRLAREQRQRAAWWRGLATLPGAQADRLQDQLFLRGIETVDALIVLAGKQDSAPNLLALLASAITHPLLEFALEGRKNGSEAFMAVLNDAVSNFEWVASCEPEVFRAWCRKSDAIPGLISRNPAQSRFTNQLLEALQQGEDSFLAPSMRKRRGRPWLFERANILAYRLISHIQRAKAAYENDKRLAQHSGRTLPRWREEAVKLKPFSPETWRSWTRVSWDVIAEISPENNPARHRGFYEVKTKICDVRKPASTDRGERGKANGVAAQDIKEALFGAFEQLATGTSRRTRERSKAKTSI